MGKDKKIKIVDDKYTFAYTYWLLNEISKCINKGYSTKKIHRFALSKIIPKMESLLNEVRNDDSKRY